MTLPTAPPWLEPLVGRARTSEASQLSRFLPPEDGSGRASAVLMLLASPTGHAADADLLLIERSATMRSHAGQVAFPGGAQDPEDGSATVTALREATEEVGLRAETVTVLAELPALFLPPSGFVVTPVLAPIALHLGIDPVLLVGLWVDEVPAGRDFAFH